MDKNNIMETLKEAIDNDRLYVADLTKDNAYVYYAPNDIEHEHAAHYVKVNGCWTFDDNIYGDLPEALGGEEAEALALALLGLVDE